MIKLLFLIHDLGQGGAEKVLVNLVNNMDASLFDITVIALFGGGVNEQFLSPHIKYKYIYSKIVPGNSHLMKLLSAEKLHSKYIKSHYDIEIAYLEGPSTRIISGCTDQNTRLVSWIHSDIKTKSDLSASFRSFEEAERCYRRFDKIVCVSETIRRDFLKLVNLPDKACVLYNVFESDVIKMKSQDFSSDFDTNSFNIISVGTLKEVKGHIRLLSIIKRLIEQSYRVHLYILGEGPLKKDIQKYMKENNLNSNVTLLGYQKNPYKFIRKADLFVCSSYSEGFSTATIEALILEVPVCTVEVSGMKEILGNNEFGIITKNDDEELLEGIKNFIDNSEMLSHYKIKAKDRGKDFIKSVSIHSIESMFMYLYDFSGIYKY